RTTADVRGYVGLLRQTVLAVRGLSVSSNKPLPVYEQSLVGGAANLRGYDLGYWANDNLAAVSAELRLPFTGPRSIGRFGMKAFVDAAAAYAAGAKMADQHLETGYGAGIYMHLTILSMSFDVGWPDKGGGPNLHFGMGIAFK
ncbi:MAG: outer membrane protein assembly factor, partial [Betaproteobacteria bacterium]|nr:outer membrane protein assembly factor [Betaproteobacteria bacterium]